MSANARISVLFFFAASAWAQLSVNIRPGPINYAEGQVYLDEVPLRFSTEKLHEVRKGQYLRTGTGKAEMQLGLAGTLWLGEQSKLQMDESDPANVQLLIVQGSVYIELIEKYENLKMAIRFGDATVELKEIGFYRLDCSPPGLRVYDGLAQISQKRGKAKVKAGKSAEIAPRLRVSGFDKDPSDPLHIWATQRSDVLYGRIKQRRNAMIMWQRLADLRQQRMIEDGLRQQAYNRMMQDQANEAQRMADQQRVLKPPPEIYQPPQE